MTEADEVKIGVLIIGSLFWDPSDPRKKWRCERLDPLVAKRHVRAPIRYGRKSSTRGNSYTMVFSAGLCEKKFGQAIVVPCRRPVRDTDDLVEEAVYLWAARETHVRAIIASRPIGDALHF